MDTKIEFICDFCGAIVGTQDTACGQCGLKFSQIRCPQCGCTGNGELFQKGCPTCGHTHIRKIIRRHKKLLSIWGISFASIVFSTLFIIFLLKNYL